MFNPLSTWPGSALWKRSLVPSPILRTTTTLWWTSWGLMGGRQHSPWMSSARGTSGLQGLCAIAFTKPRSWLKSPATRSFPWVEKESCFCLFLPKGLKHPEHKGNFTTPNLWRRRSLQLQCMTLCEISQQQILRNAENPRLSQLQGSADWVAEVFCDNSQARIFDLHSVTWWGLGDQISFDRPLDDQEWGVQRRSSALAELIMISFV